MKKTPYGLRTHIGLLGRRNSGKSSILNAITHQQTSIVSPEPGTTTDPVLKSMELQPIGPVVFHDTAGLDDIGLLGESRVQKTERTIDRLDVAILVAVAGDWGEFEEKVIDRLENIGMLYFIAFNKCDMSQPDPKIIRWLDERGIRWVQTIATREQGIDDLRRLLTEIVSKGTGTPQTIAGDLVSAGEMALLVTPIDREAPRGRLILPQVQVIRDLLDNDAWCVVVKENGLKQALNSLSKPPKIVITDSQAFKQVSEDTPSDIQLTSFSIVFARFKGDLKTAVDGVRTVDELKSGDNVLIAEACTHHPVEDDIGTVKIPRWLNSRIGGELNFTNLHGADFPDRIEDVKKYKLVIHCGACNFSRRQMLSRIEKCRSAGVPITNYGVVISHALGILDRALQPFRHCLDVD